jgi:hypothetical protein
MTDRATAAVGTEPAEPDDSGVPEIPSSPPDSDGPPDSAGSASSAGERGSAASTAAPAAKRPQGLGRFRLLRRRGWLAVVGLVLILVVGLLAATLRLFVFPKSDQLTKADAIIMFDGIGGRKYTTYWLAEHGYAPVVLISTQDLTYCRKSLPTIAGVEISCFVPAPATTRGEAEATERLATEHGWKKVIVVTGRPQETRARIRVERCYSGQVEIKGVSPGRDNWAKTIVYEWGALIKALVFQRSC